MFINIQIQVEILTRGQLKFVKMKITSIVSTFILYYTDNTKITRPNRKR